MTYKEALKILYTGYGKAYSPEDIYEAKNVLENHLDVLECFKKYFDFELVFENNQTYLIFKSKERYLPIDSKLSISNKYYEPLLEWIKNDNK